MEQVRFVIEFEWNGRVERVTLLAAGLRDVGRWLDERYRGIAVVRIERATVD